MLYRLPGKSGRVVCNHPSFLLWMKYILCLILFFTLTIADLATWASSKTGIRCELSQTSCSLLFDSNNQALTSLSNIAIPECFELCHPEIQNSSLPLVSSVTQKSVPGNCKCTNGSGGHSSAYRYRLKLNKPIGQFICTTLPPPFHNTWPDTVILCKLTKSFMPPTHLRSLSTIVIIV